jgi:hypothetical protein
LPPEAGFVLTEEEAQDMIVADPRNRDVIFPYLIGRDVNSRPDQSPSRWVINFFDWPLERAREYELPFKRIEDLVYHDRQQLKDTNSTGAKRKKYWWLYGSDSKNLYAAISGMERVIVNSRVSKLFFFVQVSNNQVFSDRLNVFALDSDSDFVQLNSALHMEWCWRYKKTQGETRLIYGPVDHFRTFPFIDLNQSGEAKLAESIRSARKSICDSLDSGLTDVYNAFHDASSGVDLISDLRDVHVEIDTVVRDAYGWSDIDLGHDFHEIEYLPENDNIRFTICAEARKEVLKRLLLLNHERAAAEQKK